MTFSKAKYVFLLVIQCAIFGFSFVVIKKLIELGCSTFMLMSIRFFIGVVFLVMINKIISSKKNIISSQNTKDEHFKREAIYGILAGTILFVAFALQTFGARYTTPAKNGLLTGLFVVLVPILSMMLKKKFSIKSIVVAFICFIGVYIVSNASLQVMEMNIGDFLTILCGFMFAIHFVVLEKFALNEDINVFRFTVIQLLMVTLISLTVSLLFENNNYGSVEWGKTIGWFLFIGAISTSVTYIIQTVVQAKLTANTVSVISCTESVFAIIISLLLGYEIFSNNLLFGSIIIISSMIYASLMEKEKKNEYEN